MLSDTTTKRLDAIGEISKTGKRINGLFRLMENPALWEQAYANIYSNKGAMTKGVDGATLDGFSSERAVKVIKLLKEGRYRFKPSRRVYIPKANGKMRPLGIPSADDKLVQEVVRILLERIYEPVFKGSSHGFRPRRSCHTALRYVQKCWTGVKWIIDMDIRGFFDNIDHEILVKLVEKRIDDRRFISLIKAMLKAGYIDDWKYHSSYSGTPQGGIVSPILANVYLHELDEFMENLAVEFNKGKERRLTKEYIRYKVLARQKRVQYAKAQKIGLTEQLHSIRSNIRDLNMIRRTIPSSDFHDPGYKKLTYIRYADDFLVGIIGTKEDCRSIMQTVCQFVENQLHLEISEEKSGVRHSGQKTRFLGYDITTYLAGWPRKMKINGIYAVRRCGAGRIQLCVPEEKILRFCQKNGYGNYDSFEARPRLNLVNLMNTQILTIYNAELRGFANYYVLARNAKRALQKLQCVWIRSFIRTLARKHRCSKREVRRAIKVAPGEHAITEQHNGKLHTTRIFRLKDLQDYPARFPMLDAVPNTAQYRTVYSELLSRMRRNMCEYCGQEGGHVVVHHIGKMSNIADGTESWKELMRRRRRKTLVLCTCCHQLLHQGKLPDWRKTRQQLVESRMR
ncbi:MAG: reverse transcriptase domain-containing protein [Syntrophobacteraceae bacterium]